MIKTGFSFIDMDLGGLHAGDLATVQGECIQTEQFIISLTQSITENNDGFALIMNTLDFPLFTSTIFDNSPADGDYALIGNRISKDSLLTRHGLPMQDDPTQGVDLLLRSYSAWLNLKKFQHLKDKKLLAVVTPIYKLRYGLDEDGATLMLKDVAHILDIPVICWQRDSSEDLIATDMTFKLSAVNGYKEPIDIEAVNPSGNTVLQIQANISSLKYTEHLKDCQKLWFYEEKDNEQ
jgi:hypothetical protein